MRIRLTLLVVCLAVACSSEKDDDGHHQPGTPTYHQDVAPLIQDNCISCHMDGSIAPFALDGYEAVKQWGPAALSAVTHREMPPFAVDNTGSCGTYQDARWLSDQQIATFKAWVDSGMPEGEPAQTTKQNQSSGLRGNPVVADMGVTYQPKFVGGNDDYRCFLIDAGITEDRFLTAFEVDPGNPAIVHHIILMSILTPEAEDQAAVLEHEDAAPGYSCYGGGRVASLPIAAWAPGITTIRYPEGTGLRMVAGRKLIMQVHYYQGSGNTDPDRTKVRLELEEQVPEEAFIFGAGYPEYFELPPGQEETKLNAAFSLAAMSFLGLEEADLLGVFPHMHSRGRTMNLSVETSGDVSCVSDVPRYDFEWQQFYFFDEPAKLRPEQTALVECIYDTRGETAPVTAGLNTDNEMCLFGFYMTAPGFSFELYSALLSQIGNPMMPPPPNGRPPSAELTFDAMRELELRRFGGNDAIVNLLAGMTGGVTGTNADSSFLLSVAGASEVSAFPLAGLLYGGPAMRNLETNAWTYTGRTDLDEVAVDVAGRFATSPQNIALALGPLPLALSEAIVSGTMKSSGAITGIDDLTIDGCISDTDFELMLEAVGPAAAFVRDIVELDCDLDADGVLDAYRVEVVTQPSVVSLAE